jgi:hypothetical protein
MQTPKWNEDENYKKNKIKVARTIASSREFRIHALG